MQDIVTRTLALGLPSHQLHLLMYRQLSTVMISSALALHVAHEHGLLLRGHMQVGACSAWNKWNLLPAAD